MHHALLIAAPAAGALVAVGLAALLVALARRRPAPAPAERHVVPPRSPVRLLETEEELAEAARRAASFEHRAAQRAQARAELYDELADTDDGPTATPVPDTPPATVHELGERSAS